MFMCMSKFVVFFQISNNIYFQQKECNKYASNLRLMGAYPHFIRHTSCNNNNNNNNSSYKNSYIMNFSIRLSLANAGATKFKSSVKILLGLALFKIHHFLSFHQD